MSSKKDSDSAGFYESLHFFTDDSEASGTDEPGGDYLQRDGKDGSAAAVHEKREKGWDSLAQKGDKRGASEEKANERRGTDGVEEEKGMKELSAQPSAGESSGGSSSESESGSDSEDGGNGSDSDGFSIDMDALLQEYEDKEAEVEKSKTALDRKMEKKEAREKKRKMENALKGYTVDKKPGEVAVNDQDEVVLIEKEEEEAALDDRTARRKAKKERKKKEKLVVAKEKQQTTAEKRKQNDEIVKAALAEQDIAVVDSGLDTVARAAGRYFQQGSSAGVLCYNCGERGHMSRDCTQEEKVRPCMLCGSLEHQRSSCPHEVCYKCRQPGHVARNCTERGFARDACYRCGFRGHPAHLCSYFKTKQDEVHCVHCGKLGHFSCFTSLSEEGETVQVDVPPPLALMCHNCGERGHAYDECSYGSRSLSISTTDGERRHGTKRKSYGGGNSEGRHSWGPSSSGRGGEYSSSSYQNKKRRVVDMSTNSSSHHRWDSRRGGMQEMDFAFNQGAKRKAHTSSSNGKRGRRR
uniref:CCHC-type domain-containing protein n=1 Tax=Palpitomonas bilix TaxID=652834 RepID=A0A7S3G4E4_9EUKA|mmetsp:Transcript_20924/g.54033  ORF Transcript_20924/g.54033 Transcript_20924/m.54033 type:complete len:523 (+) Transcript_20924:272-1840(+)